jgi:hypothetical protein
MHGSDECNDTASNRLEEFVHIRLVSGGQLAAV